MLLSVSGQSDLYIWDTFRGVMHTYIPAMIVAYVIIVHCIYDCSCARVSHNCRLLLSLRLEVNNERSVLILVGDMIVSGDASGEITLRTAIPAEQTNSSG